MMPYRNIAWQSAPDTKSNHFIVNNMLAKTQRPKSVRFMVDEFISGVVKADHFVGIHWRYDLSDFAEHCHNAVHAS